MGTKRMTRVNELLRREILNESSFKFIEKFSALYGYFRGYFCHRSQEADIQIIDLEAGPDSVLFKRESAILNSGYFIYQPCIIKPAE